VPPPGAPSRAARPGRPGLPAPSPCRGRSAAGADAADAAPAWGWGLLCSSWEELGPAPSRKRAHASSHHRRLGLPLPSLALCPLPAALNSYCCTCCYHAAGFLSPPAVPLQRTGRALRTHPSTGDERAHQHPPCTLERPLRTPNEQTDACVLPPAWRAAVTKSLTPPCPTPQPFVCTWLGSLCPSVALAPSASAESSGNLAWRERSGTILRSKAPGRRLAQCARRGGAAPPPQAWWLKYHRLARARTQISWRASSRRLVKL
jgi:hypothetical protein